LLNQWCELTGKLQVIHNYYGYFSASVKAELDLYTHTLTVSCVYASHCGGYNRSSFLFGPVDVIGSVNKPIHQTQFIWN